MSEGEDRDAAGAALRSPRGTHDVLPPESARWEALITRFAALAERHGYGLAHTPIFEDARLFRRGMGDASEVVRKEMYEFEDRSGRHLALRPEGTAPIVRAFVQHHPPVPWRVWYLTPAFRYEQAQAGRYRQHHQLGAEVLGTDDPDVDVELIALAHDLYAEIGLTRYRLGITSLGDQVCRPAYLEALTAYLETVEDKLCDACRAHLERVQTGLSAAGIAWEAHDRLVRGLDYYTRTTFEFTGTALEAASNAIGGGGRYDLLAEAIGGPHTPGIGFGAGIERILFACDAEGAFDVAPPSAQAFVVDVTGGAAARDLVLALRRRGVRAERAYDDRSMKAQLRAADRSGARVAVIVGPSELEAGTVVVRDLVAGSQRTEPVEALLARASATGSVEEPTP